MKRAIKVPWLQHYGSLLVSITPRPPRLIGAAFFHPYKILNPALHHRIFRCCLAKLSNPEFPRTWHTHTHQSFDLLLLMFPSAVAIAKC
ncbi:uncharacterized protein BO95DRAFT_438081 [Aspergillus brunneoviolaceus CBS 621.78]|uniref:Uncharacterized protein n=1 Tax=Aspergillus brunneoviolaceus CBS 621.78 TaxID=1450534 RepID=A0ACD1GP38_9EURO|nr:hypothetical protein BO95DRAFT_438081 [Aspergillus brunneoviolaceus CBS 621.78]RAH50821.1 hypothetical protein BO95DRAFT_438081 [Aspergillus brunneoviolaceus CBS 621.78]